jgi:DnaJ-class molecular chaperone
MSHLTKEQLEWVTQREAERVSRRKATWGTPECLNCEGFHNAGGAWWLNQAIYCPCPNGEAEALRHSEAREELAAAKAAEEARAARACSRCGGSGRYGNWGECYRCNGSGVDPKFRKGATA